MHPHFTGASSRVSTLLKQSLAGVLSILQLQFLFDTVTLQDDALSCAACILWRPDLA